MHLDLDTREFLIDPDSTVRLAEHPTCWQQVPSLAGLDAEQLKKRSKSAVAERKAELRKAQERLWAGHHFSVLLILQGLDACGKDSTIKHVTRGVNPAGFKVSSFRVPSREERNHHFLWRYSRALPERGSIGIFNRSYYEDVTAARVHPDAAGLDPQRLAQHEPGLWEERMEDINAFERHLDREGTVVVKCFLNVSAEAQRRRLLKRLRKPDKHWKFSRDDLRERLFRDAHLNAAEAALSATSTRWAPWYVVPADHKWLMRATVAQIVVGALGALDLRFPEPDAEKREAMDSALKALTGEA